ncbi:hypothetical protein OIDMADRAFT_158358 [Oidiodendron maius Zn]|uniref:Calcium uniporter protein n=1 Tax=Oidiodendron maius (strain Zn) TaxID=913774 RepID=A0A0C3DNN4_OIDMZ|nr:hypothetical protein OIDMADRAFT_158358 [Oidiodendron maius Zn]
MRWTIPLARRGFWNAPLTPLQRLASLSHPLVQFREFSSPNSLRNGRSSARIKALNQKSLDEHEESVKSRISNKVGQSEERQLRTPWLREGSDAPPVRRLRSAGTRTKGKLLTTPSRLLKLILPLQSLSKNDDPKSIEPLALLVHPQQPLSYLERLIQAELPIIKTEGGKEKVPEVFFRAEDSTQYNDLGKEVDSNAEEGGEKTMIDGELVKSYSGLGREVSTPLDDARFVRWSSSTEIGDFIRDAARGKEFAVEIEGEREGIRVGVPSFNDRTHYLRLRLKKSSRKLEDMAKLKKECDDIAHRSAQRIAMGGFGILVTWWVAIYHFTFQTSYGWDTMEPITYLAGLSSIMIGYLWFLYHNREVSYRAALNLTVSRRQSALYTARGFDLHKWESMVEEANALRREIKSIANEYDVEWDEKLHEMSDVRKKEDEENEDDDKEEEEGEEEGEEKEEEEKKKKKKEELEGKRKDGKND